MVLLEGGKMKSREGTVVDADDFIDALEEMAKQEIKKRQNLTAKEMQKRARSIALSAIKYYFLRKEAIKDTMFKPEEALSFEGDTGPYLQYSYARACSILKKAKKTPELKPEKFNDAEIRLIKKLADFPEAVARASTLLNPSSIANYTFQLAQVFNEFYHSSEVIGSKEESFRLALVSAFKQVMKNTLWLLDIDALEEM